jgi:hypothetical protein
MWFGGASELSRNPSHRHAAFRISFVTLADATFKQKMRCQDIEIF